jgi:hypothetical protein
MPIVPWDHSRPHPFRGGRVIVGIGARRPAAAPLAATTDTARAGEVPTGPDALQGERPTPTQHPEDDRPEWLRQIDEAMIRGMRGE